MSYSNLIQWSGLAALVGGVLLAVVSILDAVLFGGQPDSAVVTSGAFVIVELGWILAAVLAILGLVGLYARHAEQAGSLGLIAFVVAVTGTVLAAGTDWSAAFLGPWLAQIVSPEVLDAEPTGGLLVGFLVSFVLLALGWFLFGLASLRAGVLPRGAAVLLIVGAVLAMVMGFLEIPFEVVVLGLAMAWMGYVLWSGSGQPAMTAERAM